MGALKRISRCFKLWCNQFELKKVVNNRCLDNDNVLIIKLDAIGDFIIWLDSAKEYKELYHGKKCVLLCNEGCKGIAEITGYFDEIITMDIKKYEDDKLYRKKVNSEMCEHNYGKLILTAYSRTQHMDILAATVPAYKKIAFEADESKSNLSRNVVFKRNKKILDSYYDTLIPTSKNNLMELQRNAEFIRGLGKKEFKSDIPDLPRIKNVEIPQEPYFIVFPGASTGIKMWDYHNFSEVIEYVYDKRGWKCLICGSANEKYLYDLISKKTTKGTVINYCGKTSLLELIELVRNAKFVLSNDTSGIHFAAATGTIGICPFGEYNYGRFLPYESDNGEGTVRVCSKEMKCRNCAMGNMTIACVFNILIKGKYRCLDMVYVEKVKEMIDKEIIHKKV